MVLLSVVVNSELIPGVCAWEQGPVDAFQSHWSGRALASGVCCSFLLPLAESMVLAAWEAPVKALAGWERQPWGDAETH